MFRVFSAIFLWFSSAFTVVQRGEKSLVFWVVFLGLSWRAQGDGTKVTEKAQNAAFRRKPQIFADSPLEIQAFGGHRKPQKTADFRRKSQTFAENRRKPQIGLRHLRCVTFSSAPFLRKHQGMEDQGSWSTQVLGTFFLWFGWYGFNCGSTLGLADNATGQLAAHVAMNTTIAAATGETTMSN